MTARLGDSVRATLDLSSQHESPDAELIVVNDGSTDSTFQELFREALAGGESANRSSWNIFQMRGTCAAVRSGLARRGERPIGFLFFDADLSTLAESKFRKWIEPIANGDVDLAFRFATHSIAKKTDRRSTNRGGANRPGAFSNFIVLNRDRDAVLGHAQCGFKSFRHRMFCRPILEKSEIPIGFAV
jgi:glycosyltransferase involved in cell wall biosynthesis